VGGFSILYLLSDDDLVAFSLLLFLTGGCVFVDEVDRLEVGLLTEVV
jgi:hypothetical protein